MDAEVRVRDVKQVESRSGNTRWVLTDDADKEIPADELYDKLEPFKRRVAEDIRDGDDPARS